MLVRKRLRQVSVLWLALQVVLAVYLLEMLYRMQARRRLFCRHTDRFKRFDVAYLRDIMTLCRVSFCASSLLLLYSYTRSPGN